MRIESHPEASNWIVFAESTLPYRMRSQEELIYLVQREMRKLIPNCNVDFESWGALAHHEFESLQRYGLNTPGSVALATDVYRVQQKEIKERIEVLPSSPYTIISERTEN